METLNHDLFLWLNAPEHPQAWVLAWAIFCAQWLVFTAPLLVIEALWRGSANARRAALCACVAAALAMLASYAIGRLWPHPRPFMIGMGQQLLAHKPGASFPSSHLSFWWAVALAWLLQPGQRHWGVALVLLGLPMAWARIYLGGHFPADMLGAALVALACAALAALLARSHWESLQGLAERLRLGRGFLR
ncbi:MAG: phosphatase PAP2 family protein [Proteobacteria bacterium]|nr:phosphatase PAP2 family protein [Pseudomonadota bacterium]